ncbi:hypothetical protein C2845_PMPSC055481 [Panicum miliaceum]|uniref:Transposase (putative) gypsy type domain-containing protein n=1 Tax=Panicum miliaceum TaxID=4540 RepID=A0A3L6PCJ9_PANMI|nr:hypothetical protein C2845_PMPSC055481 [Panicum miliaceum]
MSERRLAFRAHAMVVVGPAPRAVVHRLGFCKAVAHWRAPPVEHEEPHPHSDEIVSFLMFHERGLGHPAHPFLLGQLNEWWVELQHLNPNGMLHIVGFITLCKGFLVIDPHANLSRAFFHGQGLTVKGDPLPTSVGGFGLEKRSRSSADYLAYTPADSNRGWLEEWFYIRNLVEATFLAFAGARPVKQNSWTWRPLTSEKGRLAFLERALRKRVTEEGLDGVRLFSSIRAHCVIPLAVRMTRMWEYTGPADPDRVSPEETLDDEVWSWVELVLKVGNQQTIDGPDAFDKGHPPNLGVAGAAKHVALVEASLARKNKKAEKAKRGPEKEMEIVSEFYHHAH